MIVAHARRTAMPRRGMLLLLVLSILALFVVVGAVGILLALRARETARAFAAATANQATSGAIARAQLDAALLKLIRGPSQPTPPGTKAQDVTESLLEDKYGGSQSCTVTGLTNTGSAVIMATIIGLDLSNPATVAGRVLTFVPAANDPTGPTSYRILGTNAAAGSVLLGNVKPNTPLAWPTVFPCEAVVNAREFAGMQPTDKHEPYDAFDDQNQFLTQPVLQRSTIASVTRPAFGGSSGQCMVDNDGDGVPDGIWLDNVLPQQSSPNGGQLSFSVSYLVLDLDGRINLNAHGSFVRAQTVSSTNTYPARPTPFVTGNSWMISSTIPPGMGYGPADVDASLLVSTAAELASGSVPARWALLLLGGTVSRNALVSTGAQWRPTPLVETVQPGRYTQGVTCSLSAPGNSSLSTGTNPANADFWIANAITGIANSPTDFKARLQVFTDGGTPPTLKFARPTGAAAWVAIADTEDIQASGTAAHPYALRLDEDAPRAAGNNSVDSPYTVGELERLLRSYDADAATLAPRLAAMLDDIAQQSRMTVTTDSWDTPAITGSTAQLVAAAVPGFGQYALLSPETVAGLRFNLNRPLTSAAARQDYFRQFYTLMVALTGTAKSADAAQWTANVIEFRDPDSIMTRYPYDTNPLDGTWDDTGTSVWGAERPEMVIESASASGTQLTVSLYRPWKAQLCVGNTITGVTERIDGNLGDPIANTLDPRKTNGSDSVWRIATSSTAVGLATLITTATTVGTNASLALPKVTANDPSTVRLERLADPSQPFNASSNPYVAIHSVSAGASGTVSRWLHWPNRDLVSHGELLAVQSGSTTDLAAVLLDGTKEASLARSYPAILEATIVPSRFAAANVSVVSGSTNLAGTGFENFQYGQFSRWREAGRVNVNTILSNTGNNPVALDDVVWTALLGLSGTPNPVIASGTYAPIKTDSDLLVAGNDARFTRSGPNASSAFLARSTAVRLANVGTTRSHVFAVWITVRITDSSPNAGPPQFARLFAIVDRSIPVAYAPGRTLNVRETIRLQRFLQ